jgi:hypothetical protein
MSRRPIALSPDLLRLRNEGYDLDVVGGFLVVRDVPAVTAAGTVERGVLFMALDLAGDVATKPTSHVAYWQGEHPCHRDGRKITAFENPSPPHEPGGGMRADFTFSAKADYRDFHHKATTYVGRIEAEAALVVDGATARTYPPVPAEEDDVFRYVDTASSRAGIGAVNERLAGLRIGIVGLGGTGAYVLDLVAKTTVAEVHLFDGDVFSQHNAFRAPGAPTLEQLARRPAKVDHFAEVYGEMRRGVIPHRVFLDATNAGMLDGLDFAFLCLDRANAKRSVVGRLTGSGTPFVDVGMGVLLQDGLLAGIVRTTTSTAGNRAAASPHISFADGDGAANEYSTNIQIAELNALNAALAVVQWKKLFGIYRDSRQEHYGGYSIASGEIVSEGES